MKTDVSLMGSYFTDSEKDGHKRRTTKYVLMTFHLLEKNVIMFFKQHKGIELFKKCNKCVDLYPHTTSTEKYVIDIR